MTDESRRIGDVLDSAEVLEDDYDAATDSDGGGDDGPPQPPVCDGDDAEPSGDGPNPDVVQGCAVLDASDTDNGERLIRHFGRDLAVLAQDEVPTGAWLAWSGTHWDLAGGAARARIIAQRLGDRIMLEARYLKHTPDETRAIEQAQALRTKDPATLTPEERLTLSQATAATDALKGRAAKRRAFGVTSKNKARMENALDCAGPRLRRSPDGFNVDRYKVATLTHTLQFLRVIDPECPDPDALRFVGRCDATPGHNREDWMTAVVPQPYDAEAKAEGWRAFMAEMLPDAEKRRTVQQFTALGLLGIPTQFLMFHYGLGANGKSVFLETITRVLGAGLCVGLPRESIVGASERAAGSASPDLVRLYGKKMVRILEVKGDAPLQEDLIKRLTGGEAVPVRTLFKGYFEFQNVATAHMSGNSMPTIDGTDNGIWRRLLVVHWDQTVPEEKRRDFEEMVSGFVREEGAGILNWMVEGVCDFLENGLVIAPAVRTATAEYREEMDPIGEFMASCMRASNDPLMKVPAHAAYEAYVSWSLANAKRARSQTKFGRVVGQRFQKTEQTGRIFYLGCELHDVPARPDVPRNPND